MRALVTGARGQDGTLLLPLLKQHGREVLGVDLARRGLLASADGVHDLDLRDATGLETVFDEFLPDEVYHLAACHHSSEQSGDFSLDLVMIDTNFRVVERLLARISTRRPQCRILIAGSSQMYRAIPGKQTLIDESTAMTPVSFYGLTKSWSRSLLAHFRDKRGIFACTGILFNHESPLRTPSFVTRKVSMAAARAKAGVPADLHIRDISSATDWSSATDVVEGLRLAMSATEPRDYVFASGVPRTIEQLLECAFDFVGLDWRTNTTFELPGPGPRGILVGDATRARTELGWTPKVEFEQLIAQMVTYDLRLLGQCQAEV